jgi:hypothetical protein
LLPYLEQYAGQQLRTGPQAEAYAFSEIGTVMLWGAIASFVLAAILAVLVGLGSEAAAHVKPRRPSNRDARARSPPTRASSP